MARKPYRHKKVSPEAIAQIEDLLQTGKVERDLVRQRPSLLMSQREFQAFMIAAIKALVRRLARYSPREAKAAKDAMRRVFHQFGAIARAEGMDTAKSVAEDLISKLPPSAVTRDMNIALAILVYLDSLPLTEEISRLPKDKGKRKRWLRENENMSEEKAEFIAPERSESDLLELILGHRYDMEKSAVHKALARGPKELRSLLAQLT